MSIGAAIVLGGAAVLCVGISWLAWATVQIARESQDVPKLDARRVSRGNADPSRLEAFSRSDSVR